MHVDNDIEQPNSCSMCTRLRREPLGGEDDPQTCEAFPAGIPDLIWIGDEPHFEAFEGDNGMQFDPFDADARNIVLSWFGDSVVRS